MFGNFNSSDSCFKKKKRKGGVIYRGYWKIRWPQINVSWVNEATSGHLPPLLHPLLTHLPVETTSCCQFHKLLLSPPPNFFSKFSSSPLPSLPKALTQVAPYEGTLINERKKNPLVKHLCCFFSAASISVTCLSSEQFLAFILAFKRGPGFCIYWQLHKGSFKIDFCFPLPRWTDASRSFWNKHCFLLPQEPAVSLFILLFKESPGQAFINLPLAI